MYHGCARYGALCGGGSYLLQTESRLWGITCRARKIGVYLFYHPGLKATPSLKERGECVACLAGVFPVLL